MSQSPVKPCIGRTIHFHTGWPVSPGSAEWKPNAATIADVLNDAGNINLSYVLHSGEMASAQNVPFSLEPKAGCWSWPPRV